MGDMPGFTVQPKINTLVKSFTDLINDLQKYHQRQGKTQYAADKFQWLRSKEVADISNPKQLCEPYPLDELNEQGKKYIDLKGNSPARKDYAVLDLETSLLFSFARAFNERHTTRLRHFSHSAGTSDIISAGGTGMIDQIHTHASSLLGAD